MKLPFPLTLLGAGSSTRRGLVVVFPNFSSQLKGTPPTNNMAKVNSGSSGCRAMVMAGKYLSSPSPPALTRNSGHRQRRMFGPQRRMASSDAAGVGGKTVALAHKEHLGCFSASDRHALANRNLIYRDVKAFLNEVGGDPREARYWLTQFQRAASAQSPFAVLEVDSSVFDSREMVQRLSFGLSFLQRMDMKPVVVMGWSEREETGPREPVAGSRCTQGLVERSQQLTEALQQHSATVLPLFSAESFLLLHEAPHGSSAPPSITVDTSLLQWSLDCGTIPLVCPVLDTVSLPSDLPSLSTAAWLRPVERRRVTTIARLLNQLSTESSAVITSADTLLTELFSHRGSGTLFKNGDPIHRYSAAAIITMEPVNNGTPYLDKFVISSSKQGQGTSHILWECIRQDLGKLFWRSRATNRINPWYFKHCDGSFVNGVWTVFWFGLTDIRDSYGLVEYAKNLPDSFHASSISSSQQPPTLTAGS
ncbi:N-acetylglutamate synthase, mitochondrial [Collichthys lucidus]|uniref:N-acetylglutamate synthase, mitochondrial n=1 Tax=Collichthys lucidus TaxID=240159 RepID=A0A4U5VXZ1_COLLU|nr:N-acetylglutamate synthase, mitochondrial [Collichthys lucidus]